MPVEQRRDPRVLELGVIAAPFIGIRLHDPAGVLRAAQADRQVHDRSAGCPSAPTPSLRSRPRPCADRTAAARPPTGRPASRSGTCRRSSTCPPPVMSIENILHALGLLGMRGQPRAAAAVLVAPDERQRPSRRAAAPSPRSPSAARSPAPAASRTRSHRRSRRAPGCARPSRSARRA